MRNRPLILIPLLFSVIVFSAMHCRKHDCSKDKPKQVLLPQEVLDYVDFKTGSYWVYQDSATGRIDSEVVVSSRHVMEDISTTNDCGDIAVTNQYENIEMKMQRYDELGNLIFAWTRNFDNSYKHNSHDLDNDFIIANGSSFLIGYPFDQTYYVGDYKSTETYSDTLIIKGKMYYSIITVKNESISAPANKSFILIAKNIGKLQIINIVPGDPDNYINLLRYKIN